MENLTRCPPAIAEQFRLPPSSKSFLTEVGLPSPKNDPLWMYGFDLLAPVRMPGRSSCLQISLKPRPICIDERQGGRVVMPLIEGDRERFVNSTAEQLGAFLTVCQAHQKELLAADGNTQQSRLLVTSLRDKMQEIDPAALEDENSFWSFFVMDMWYPLMTDQELKALG